jgi:hypothetical protein
VQNNLRLQLGHEIADVTRRVICPPISARSMRVSGSANHSGADRTSDRATSLSAAALFSFFSGTESFCKQGLETWIAAQGIKERTDFDESDKGIAAFEISAFKVRLPRRSRTN